MGSGHILVYAFDLFVQLYVAEGYRERDAVELILTRNLFGLDIDKRAFQLTYFALMMKGRQYSRRIFSKRIKPNVYAISENFGISEAELQLLPIEFQDNPKAYRDLLQLIDGFKDCSVLGSLIEFNGIDFDNLISELNKDESLFLDIPINEMLCVGKLLQRKYEIVITNPPYMGSSGFNSTLSKFAKTKYPNSKSDLFAIFIERWNNSLISSGYNSMVTMQSWMFLSSYEAMRKNIVSNYTIANMMHMENMVMGIAFGTAVSILQKAYFNGFKGTYHQIKTNDVSNGKLINTIPISGNRFNQISQDEFNKIPGSPISYWVSENVFKLYDESLFVSSVGSPVKGIDTGNNDYFLKYWFEVNKNKTSFQGKQHKWFPYNKGGEVRRWYGNREYLINYENDGYELKNFSKSNLRNKNKYLLPSLSWSTVTSSRLSVRANGSGFLFDNGGSSYFSDEEHLIKVLALLNSKVAESFLQLSPTLNFQPGDIGKVIYLKEIDDVDIIDTTTKLNIRLVKDDWDSSEASWDFKKHPLI